MSDVKIRIAQPGDEPSIAKVHIQAWQEAYKGLLPQDYLDQLSSELGERIDMWKRIMINPKRWAWVAEGSQGTVGFALFGPPRDQNREGYIELGAIYLLASEKGNGIGFALLSAGFNKMKDLGYKKAYCWVLENNPTIKFYERSGAQFSNQVKEDDIGGKNFKELAYEWNDLNLKKSKTMNEFWSYFLQITFHEGKPERWTHREKKAKWLLDHLNLKKDSHILELGCGDGIVDIWLSRLGFDVTAVDRAGSVLDHARKEDDTKKVNFITSDLREVEFSENAFDGIFIFETLGLLKKEEDFKLLQETYRWLKPGGKIAVDCPIKPSEKNVWKKELTAGVVNADTSFDLNTRIHRLNFEFQPKDAEAFSLKDPSCSNYDSEAGISRYIYTQEELSHLLEAVGYKVKSVPHYYSEEYFALIGIKK